MKVSISKYLLSEGLGYVSRISTSKATTPILECCLLSTRDGGLVLSANDLESAIETNPIESEIVENGAVAIDLKVFGDIVRSLPGPAVEISVDDKNLATIKSGKAEFKILGMDAAEFPEFPQVVKNQGYKINSLTLKNMVRQTVFSVATDNSKPVLCGQLLDISNDGTIKVVAVDGFRISLRQAALEEGEYKDAKIVISGKTMNEVSKILPADADAVTTFYCSDQHVLFDLENCTVVSRLLEGEFVSYENMFTSESTTIATVSREEILESIDRATLISRDTKKNPVKFKIENSNIGISTNAELGASYEEVSILQDGPDLEIAFNPRYLTDVMKVLDGDKIIISFTSSLSPCIITLEGSEDYKYLILPLRLRG